jgi:SAM-dependent methyltransferase
MSVVVDRREVVDAWPISAIAESTTAPRALVLRSHVGDVIALHVARWFGAPSVAEHEVLAHALPPVLDVGCGPARHTLALAARGVEALGLDISPSAVRAARRRGARVLHGDVFADVPGRGTWGTALLLDGNIGIGGDPARLLVRIRELLHPHGRALVELGAPRTGTEAFVARIEGSSSWFPWATVAADDIAPLALGAGLRSGRPWSAEGRWFARLDR